MPIASMSRQRQSRPGPKPSARGSNGSAPFGCARPDGDTPGGPSRAFSRMGAITSGSPGGTRADSSSTLSECSGFRAASRALIPDALFRMAAASLSAPARRSADRKSSACGFSAPGLSASARETSAPVPASRTIRSRRLANSSAGACAIAASIAPSSAREHSSSFRSGTRSFAIVAIGTGRHSGVRSSRPNGSKQSPLAVRARAAKGPFSLSIEGRTMSVA